ncbi:MAG: AraC family transcriptional regulator ligand-binding domain-containing protein [Myxococcota bacterium]
MTTLTTLHGVIRIWIEAARAALVREPVTESAGQLDGDLDVAWLSGALRDLERVAGTPSFALQAAASVRPDALGMISFARSARPTVGEGLASVARYLQLLSPQVRLTSHPDGAWAQLTLVLPRGTPVDAASRCAAEFTFAHIIHQLRALADVNVQKVTFRHAPVPYRDAYDTAFRAPVEFNRDVDSITIPSAHLDMRLPPYDCSTGVRVRRGASQALRSLPEVGATSAQVREVILDEVIGGIPHMTRVATRLGMTVPALAAVLKEEHATFAGLREELLYRLASEYLADEQLGLVDVAFVVGFVDYDVFVRTFTRWSGKSPKAYRRDL